MDRHDKVDIFYSEDFLIVIVGPPDSTLSRTATATVRCNSFCHAEGERALLAGRGAGTMIKDADCWQSTDVVMFLLLL